MTDSMTPKDIIGAANALIGWFNSQGISVSDADLVMSKVYAKMYIGASTDLKVLGPLMKAHMDQLAQDMADRVKHVR